MKKQLSRALLVVMALSLALSLAACGKKSLEDAVNNDKEIQSSIEELKTAAAAQNMTIDVYAEGDALHYDYILPLTVTAEELETALPQLQVMADSLKESLQGLANDLKGDVSNSSVKIVVNFYDEAKTELLTTEIEAE